MEINLNDINIGTEVRFSNLLGKFVGRVEGYRPPVKCFPKSEALIVKCQSYPHFYVTKDQIISI